MNESHSNFAIKSRSCNNRLPRRARNRHGYAATTKGPVSRSGNLSRSFPKATNVATKIEIAGRPKHDELRSAVDQLSLELARANGELSDLREANAGMSARLDDVQRERDVARQDVESRPTNEEFQSLREELDAANDQLSEMKREYDETLARLSEVEAARNSERELEAESEEGPSSAATAIAAGTVPARLTDLSRDDLQQTDDDDVSGGRHHPSPSDDPVSESFELQSESAAAESHYEADESTAVDDSQEDSLWSDAAAVPDSSDASGFQTAIDSPDVSDGQQETSWPNDIEPIPSCPSIRPHGEAQAIWMSIAS